MKIELYKNKEDVKGFFKAGQIASQILTELLNCTEEGTTTKELDERARELCEENNCEPMFLNYKGFPASICASVNNIFVHGIPNETPLQSGDLISIDIGIKTPEGHIADTAETIWIGEIEEHYKKLVRDCRTALNNAIGIIKENSSLVDISREISKIAKQNGYALTEEYGGHGVGKNILHASPFISNVINYESDVGLYPGMLLAIEPMYIYGKNNSLKIADDEWGVVACDKTAHCEHTILITEDGVVITTAR